MHNRKISAYLPRNALRSAYNRKTSAYYYSIKGQNAVFLI
ncbi:hypothetical protein NBRC111894_4148 [Sporolactobacillus inulinus]|uniref:Uncharacterized protein n=1 Tax=Sporolactobacillus inulinus TaxID=2078 RepID=A0A4Y1ZI54_9BACL|nr:hypothetical protein NBRC111894_4148 [Sporolactobacillus inulinus]